MTADSADNDDVMSAFEASFPPGYLQSIREQAAGLMSEPRASVLNSFEKELFKYEYAGPRHYSVIKELAAWADYHSMNIDLALLVCSCEAAHLAGPKLQFRNGKMLSGSLPITIVGAAEDSELQHVIEVATESLLEIEAGTLDKNVKGNESYFNRRMDTSDSEERNIEKQLRRMSEDARSGRKSSKRRKAEKVTPPKPFVLRGAIPAKPEKELQAYHLYTAFAAGAIEQLPNSSQAREKRANLLSQTIKGVPFQYKDSQGHEHKKFGSVRGIMRFPKEDLLWLVGNKLNFMKLTLPLSIGGGEQRPAPTGIDSELAKVFDYARRRVLRNVLQGRNQNGCCFAEFQSKRAEEEFLKQQEDYNSEILGLSHLLPVLKTLPDMLIWYLFQFCRYYNTEAQELQAVDHVFTAARNLRRRAMGFYNDCDAVKQARARLGVATKLVDRMRRLNRPSRRRELVRGLNDQRTNAVGPVIDTLQRIGVFTEDGKLLSLCSEAKPLQEQDFMEPGRTAGEPTKNSLLWPRKREPVPDIF